MKFILNSLIILVLGGLLQGCGGGGGGSSSSSSSSTSTTSSSGSSTTVTETTTVTDTVSESEYIDSEYTTCEDDCSESESDYVCEDDCYDDYTDTYVDTYIDTTTTYTDTYVDTTYTDTYVDSTSTYVGGGSSSYTPVYIPPPKTTTPVVPAPIPYGTSYLTVTLPAVSAGLWWDESSNILYIGDETNKALQPWSEAQGFLPRIPLSIAPSGATEFFITQVFKFDNQFLVAMYPENNNFSTEGSFISQMVSERSEVIQGISSMLERVGFTKDDQGQLYEYGTVRKYLNYSHEYSAFVNQLSFIPGSSPPTAQEREVIYDDVIPAKIDGCVISGGTLYVTKSFWSQIFSVPVSQLVVRQKMSQLKVSTIIPHPELLVGTEDGRLFVSGTSSFVSSMTPPSIIYEMSPKGVASQFTQFKAPLIMITGMAYDAVNKRLFVITHEPWSSSQLYVFNLKK